MRTTLRLIAALSVAFLGAVVMKVTIEILLEGVEKAHSWGYITSKHGLVWLAFVVWGAILASLGAGLWFRMRYAAWTVLLLTTPQVIFWTTTALHEGFTGLLAAGITALSFAAIGSALQIRDDFRALPTSRTPAEGVPVS